MSDLVTRLRELSGAIARGDRSELTMRIPAEPERDANIVLSTAADELERLQTELSRCRQELESLKHDLAQAMEGRNMEANARIAAESRGDEAVRRLDRCHKLLHVLGTVLIGPPPGRKRIATLVREIHGVLRMLNTDAAAPERQERCRIMEYDGAYRCATHNRKWGAVPEPDEPCATRDKG